MADATVIGIWARLKRPVRVLSHIAAVAFFVVCFLRTVGQNDVIEPVTGDAYGYVTTAFNLYTDGVFSHICEDFTRPCPVAIVPTNYREPLYPFFLALAFSTYPEVITRSDVFVAFREMSPSLHAHLRKFTMATILGTALMAMGITYLVSGSWLAAYAALFLVGTSPNLTHNIRMLLSENLAGMLLSAATFFALLAFNRKKLRWFACAGFFWGLLTLTKAIYCYGFYICGFASLIVFLLWKIKRREILCGFLSFAILYGVVVGSWALRNYTTFGSTSLSSRGGIMLTIRVFYNQVNWEEFKGLFWYENPFGRWLNYSEKEMNRVSKLSRTNEEGYYRASRNYALGLSNQIGPNQAEVVLKKEAMGRILSEPIKHLMVSIPLAFNSLFVEDGKWVQDYQIMTSFEIGILFLLCIVLGLVVALFKRNLNLALVAGPAVFSVVFHALISNGLSRYNQPLIGLLWSLSVILTYLFLRRAYRVVVALGKRIFYKNTNLLNSVG